jgi:hypothetical protein
MRSAGVRPDSERRLRAFVARVAKIESYPYFKGGTNISGCTLRRVDGDWVAEFHAPPDHDTDAVLLHLRLLVQNDDISIGRLAELYTDLGISEAWKKEHEHWRAILNQRLDDRYAEGPQGFLTYRDVLKMFLYGDAAHYREKDEAYQLRAKWIRSEEERALTADTFQQVIIWILAVAHNIAVASRVELRALDDVKA